MSKTLRAVRGMHDILPSQTAKWRHLESIIKRILCSYGYDEIRFPVIEKTDLFKRTIGEVTDIVEKEMYTFADRNGDSLSLRPEGTAGCVRACLENGLLHNETRRLWYMGPMFRHERPQKGRYRQFYQIGVEAFGMDGPDIDAELIMITARLWRELGLNDLELQLNSLGTSAARGRYREHLVEYFKDNIGQLDSDSVRRLESNPLRILDSKNRDMQCLIENAPQLSDYLDSESSEHFELLKELLDLAGISYRVNPRLVRGLDYYGKTVFEWVTTRLGAQGTVCAGGRYDGLVEQLGGKATPAVGFAMGMERLLALQEESGHKISSAADIYIVLMGGRASKQGLLLAEKLHDSFPSLVIKTDCSGGSVKSQFKKADRCGAHIALVLGDDEIDNDVITVKFLRKERPQQVIGSSDLDKEIAGIFDLSL